MRRFVSSLSLFALALSILGGMTLPVQAETPSHTAENTKLVKSVILFRHGVRSPTQSADTLAAWTSRSWPQWPVAPGKLTKRGARLMQAAGIGLRASLAEDGLLPATGCPPEGSVFVYADSVQRTQASGDALLDGLARGCGISVHSRQGSDALFHPVQSGLMPAPVFSDEEQRTLEHELAAIRSREAEQLTLLAQLLGPSVNAADTLHFPEKGSHQLVTLKGGLKTAASASEVLLLEALQWPARAQRIPVAERLPKDGHRLSAVEIKTRQILSAPFAKRPDVRVHTPAPVWKDIPIPPNGPLMVNPRTALELLSVHSAVQNVLKKTPPSARASGLPLLIFMAEALTGTSPVKAANEATLVLLAGHDSNIAAVSALLDLHWAGRDFPPDSSPPGSMLALSLWETPQGRVVQASFLRQSLAALFSTDSTAMDSAALVHERLLLPSAAAWTPSGPGLPLAAFLSLVDTLAEGSDVKTNLPYATAPSTVPAD